jgi:hypothetical protein
MFHCRIYTAINKISPGFTCLFDNVNLVFKMFPKEEYISPFNAGSRAATRPVAQPSCRFLTVGGGMFTSLAISHACFQLASSTALLMLVSLTIPGWTTKA